MTEHKIEPHKITQPIQLLAAWLVALIIISGVFLTAAIKIENPPWASAILVLASIFFVVLFVFYIFLLQTKYRPEMQDDKYYSEQVKMRLEKNSKNLHDLLKSVDLDIEGLIAGRSIHDLDTAQREAIKTQLEGFEDPLVRLETSQTPQQDTNPSVLLEYGKALLANREWKHAAKYFDQYLIKRPSDSGGHFLRGVAHANSEGGREADVAALTAYSNAILLAPSDIDNNRLARFITYRGAMLKRLHRFDEAIVDLTKAQKLASDYYESHDIKYNLACIYGMQGESQKLYGILKQLQSAPSELARIRKHLDDYFKQYKSDAKFLDLIKQKPTTHS